MNPYLATVLVALPSAALTGWLLPLLIAKRAENHGANRESNQNLQSLSNRMAKERDRAEEIAKQAVANTEKALAKQAEIHTAEIAQMREAHLQQSKSAEDRITSLSNELAECREQVSYLVGQMRDLRKLLPPDAPTPLLRPPFQ